MKRRLMFFLLIMVSGLTGFCKIWTINNSGFSFSPATLIITLGDTVKFVISSSHDAREVSQTTWNANGNTALAGGFQTPLGGGLILPAQLGIGTHYYVCTPHASLGMKGTIIVQNITGIEESYQENTNFLVYPNPSKGQFQFSLNETQITKNAKMEISNAQGQLIYKSSILKPTSVIDLGNQPDGIYFIRFYCGQTILTKRIVIK